MHKNFISASRDLENASSFSSPVTILLTYKLFNEDIHGNIFVINRRYFKFFFFLIKMEINRDIRREAESVVDWAKGLTGGGSTLLRKI